MEENNNKMHIERVYAYGDNEHYYVDVPDNFICYEYDYFPDTKLQKHYIYFGDYNEELFNGLESVIGIYNYKIEDKMLSLFFNEPCGCFVHSREYVSQNLNELKEKLEPLLKQLYIEEFMSKTDHVQGFSELYDQWINDELSEEEKENILKKLYELSKEENRLCQVTKILSFDGYNVVSARVCLRDFLGKPADFLTVETNDLYKLLKDVEFEDDEFHFGVTYEKITRNSENFNDIYTKLKAKVEID